MENHLNSCLASKGNVTNDNFEITARFDFLSPPTDPDCTRKNPSWTGRLDLEENDDKGEEEVKQYLPETDGLWHMSQSKKHQHLLKHPVIALFLWLKWKRMGAAYNRNLAVYAAFVAVLTAYIFVLYAGRSIRAGAFLDESCGNQQGTVKNESVLAEVASNEAMLSNYRDASALWYLLLVLL